MKDVYRQSCRQCGQPLSPQAHRSHQQIRRDSCAGQTGGGNGGNTVSGCRSTAGSSTVAANGCGSTMSGTAAASGCGSTMSGAAAASGCGAIMLGCGNAMQAQATAQTAVRSTECFPQLAMSYVLMQPWEDPYDLKTGLCQGTLFAGLDKPFLGRRIYRRG